METIVKQGVPAILKDEAKFEDKVNRAVVMSNSNGSINIIALKRGQKLSQHLAPADAMVQVIEGRMNFSVGEDNYVLEAGQFLTMEKGTVHALDAIEDTKFILTLIKG